MTRAYALLALLRLGPMRWPELVECTRWPLEELQGLLDAGLQSGAIKALEVGRAGNTAYEAAV
jgi:hypothetical protein